MLLIYILIFNLLFHKLSPAIYSNKLFWLKANRSITKNLIFKKNFKNIINICCKAT